MAARKPCPACGRTFQRGELVWFASRSGMRRTRCCQSCARKGVTIVQDKSHDAMLCAHCEALPASCCSRCLASKLAAARAS